MNSNTLDHSVAKLGFADYDAYLSSPHWRAFQDTWAQSNNPKRCLACRFPQYTLHHITYTRLGKELMGDVVPLCDRCHKLVHKYHQKHKIPLVEIEKSLSAIFLWTSEECKEVFTLLINYRKLKPGNKWVNKRRDKKIKTKMKSKRPVDANSYYKISKDLQNFTKYIDEKYSIVEIAQIYGVNTSYVKGYLEKFSHLFKGCSQLEELRRGKSRGKVNVSISELWGESDAKRKVSETTSGTEATKAEDQDGVISHPF